MKDLRILSTVYEESLDVVSSKNARAIHAFEAARRKVAKSRKVDPRLLGHSQIKEVIKEAKATSEPGLRDFIVSVAAIVERTARSEEVNVLASLGLILDIAIEEDKKAISDIFLVNSYKECIGYKEDEHWRLGRLISDEHKASNEFFSLQKNSNDREIAAEAIVTAGEILKTQVRFVTDDHDFSMNFETSRIPTMSTFRLDHGLVQICHTDLC